MRNEELMECLRVPETAPLWRGVQEVLRRAEEDATDRWTAAEVSQEERANGGIALGVLRDLRRSLEGLRVRACEEVKS
jgi:hypothetical protein